MNQLVKVLPGLGRREERTDTADVEALVGREQGVGIRGRELRGRANTTRSLLHKSGPEPPRRCKEQYYERLLREPLIG